jgi:Icc-related predicted phosphoesterase
MIIDCIADLHGHYPKLEGGDLLIIAGDLTERSTKDFLLSFHVWASEQDYKKIIVIGGNHDTILENSSNGYPFYNRGWSVDGISLPFTSIEYLFDSGTEFEGLKIWGSPWTLTFPGINPHCTAFTGTEAELEAKFALIPDDTDILITHGPPYGIMDAVHREVFCGERDEWVGSASLLGKVFRICPKLHVFGHIHEGYGRYNHTPRGGSSENLGITPVTFVNCSHVNERYKPVNKPVRVVL